MTFTTCIAIVGNGPSALSLSYILNGNIPYYDPNEFGPHPNNYLHNQLLQYTVGNGNQSLLDAVCDELIIDYISQSFDSFFSDSILPINLLLDTLNGSDESSFMNIQSRDCRIKWVYDKRRKIPHIVLGNNSRPGGQWANYQFDSKDEICLSYAEMLSLPGYSFSQFYKDIHDYYPIDFYRPTRGEVSDYYSKYPSEVGIETSIESNVLVTYIDKASHDGSFVINMIENKTNTRLINCQKLVLASGIYESPIESKRAQRRLSFHELTNNLIHKNNELIDKHHHSFTIIPPLSTPPCEGGGNKQLNTTLIIGTGVSAAEAVNKSIKEGNVLHIYKWFDSKGTPCVLRRFPKELYPDFVKVFHMMEKQKVDNYEGFPNSEVLDISPDGVVEFKLEDGSVTYKTVNCVKVCTGRTGSLEYLSERILDKEIITKAISKKTLKEKYINKQQGDKSLQVNNNVYAIGSLCGDTVVRFMLGSSLSVAGNLMR